MAGTVLNGRVFRTAAGNEPVRDWLKRLSRGDGRVIGDEVGMAAAKAVLGWKLTQEMKRLKLSKAAFAARLGTSKSQVYRVLDPKNETVSLETLKKAAAAVGKKLRLELVDAA